MIDKKEVAEKHKEYIKGQLDDPQLFKYIVGLLREGNNKNNEFQRLQNVGMDIQTLKGANGIQRAKMIGDIICNSKEGNLLGINTDVFLARSVLLPKLEKNGIKITIKSCKDIKDIIKNPSTYMKKFTLANRVLDLQTDMFDMIDGYNDGLVVRANHFKYYGILTYYFSTSETLEHVSLVFFDQSIKEVICKIDIPQCMLGNKKTDTAYSDKSVLDKENLADSSLKGKLKLKIK